MPRAAARSARRATGCVSSWVSSGLLVTIAITAREVVEFSQRLEILSHVTFESSGQLQPVVIPRQRPQLVHRAIVMWNPAERSESRGPERHARWYREQVTIQHVQSAHGGDVEAPVLLR